MAPAKSAKRASKAPTPPTKKPKTDRNLLGVLDALKQAEDLPLSCRAMLEAGAPGCLGTPTSERHELQATMVSWMDKVFDRVQAKLQETLDGAESEVATANGKKEALEAKVTEAQSVVDAKAEAVKTKQSDLATASGAVQDAKGKLKAALAAQKTGEAELGKASDSKQKLETAMTEHLSFLKTEEGFEPKQAKVHMNKLTPIAKQLKLDDSLLTALPSAATQAPSKRGEFDQMVIEQLEAGIQSKVDVLDAQLKNGEAAAAERAEAVAAAQSEVEKAEETETNEQSAVAAAEVEENEAAEALKAAKGDLSAGKDEYNTVCSSKDIQAVALDNFKNYNYECYNTLRNTGEAQEAAPAES